MDKVYNEGKRTWEQQGYRVYNRFLVKVNDVNNVGKYLDAATKAGVTNIGSDSFSISDINHYYKQAQQSAVKNASSSAVALAEALDTTLGSCICVEEMTSYNSYEKEEAVDAISNMTTNATAGDADTNIRYEDIEITARVVMKYVY